MGYPAPCLVILGQLALEYLGFSTGMDAVLCQRSGRHSTHVMASAIGSTVPHIPQSTVLFSLGAHRIYGYLRIGRIRMVAPENICVLHLRPMGYGVLCGRWCLFRHRAQPANVIVDRSPNSAECICVNSTNYYLPHYAPVTMKQLRTETLGLFPLSMVVLPYEQTRLHIFESRYKQLINDCFANNKDFGIPAVVNGQPMQFGTRVKLVDIEKFYPDGKMDIKVEGVSIFRLKSFAYQLENKLYAGGEIEALELNDRYPKRQQLLDLFYDYCMRTFTENPDYTFDRNMSIFEIANSMVLDTEEKYGLIKTSNPDVQQNILLNNLRVVLALIKQEEDLNYKFFLN